MGHIGHIGILLKKDIVTELRRKHTLSGVLLYTIGTIVICYMSFRMKHQAVDVPVWNALFWILMWFTAFNTVSKSFLNERRERYIYYYTVVSPQAFIISKILYNILFMLIPAGLGLLFFIIVMGNPIQDLPLFCLILLLGIVSLCAALTLVSGIAAQTSGGYTLAAVLGLPVTVPILMMVLRVSFNAVEGLGAELALNQIIGLLAVDVIAGAVSYLLFPYLWKM